ncbi:inositol monophosphatase [Amycolatopsis sp. NPDC051371]|uniref:inositol monophosphatase family protein n=1 Tax=Amycolatopsis sp. NPDC051371 TaxID=3155800 RepID=UPI0034245804
MDIELLERIVAGVAARELVPRFGRLAASDIAEKTSEFDVVTVADRAAEAAISAAVRARWPATVVVGEEAGDPDEVVRARLRSESALVLDPLDGTKNFVSGLPLFAVMVATMRRGRIVGCVIHDPMTRTSAMAVAGAGAWLRRPGEAAQRLEVADPMPLGRMEAVAGARFAPEPLRGRLAANLLKLAGYTWFRCAGHEYRLAAAGQVHLLCYHRLKPWDHAAGWLLHREAGGFSAHFDGSSFDPGRMTGGLLCAPDEDSWHDALENVLGLPRPSS